LFPQFWRLKNSRNTYSDFEYLFSLFGEVCPVEKTLQESSDSLEKRFMKFIGFRRHHLGFVAIISELLQQPLCSLASS
jgi:hypothetical protein